MHKSFNTVNKINKATSIIKKVGNKRVVAQRLNCSEPTLQKYCIHKQGTTFIQAARSKKETNIIKV